LERAIAERGVFWSPGLVDGMGAVTAALTLPESRALVTVLGACADAVEDEPGAPPRTREQKMADCLLDLVLRPRECDLPPVQVQLTLVAAVATALGGDAPAEVDGHPVPAELARELLRGLTGVDLTGADLTGSAVATTAGGPCQEPPSPPAEPADPALEAVAHADFDGWQEEATARIHAGEFAGEPGDDESADRVRSDLRDQIPDVPIPVADLPPESDGDDWWAQADRAVDDASRAMWQAQQAMAHAGRMVRTAAASDACDEATWETGPSGRLTAAEDAMTALTIAGTAQREELGHLLESTGGGGLAERPRIAVTSAVSGALLALTDLPGLRRTGRCDRPRCRRRPTTCTHDLTGRPGLGPPPPTDGYRPGAELDRFVRARDRRCRFPGCRRQVPRTGELDHDRRYPEGSTSAANLAGYCTANHRGKHQAPVGASTSTPTPGSPSRHPPA